MTWAEFVAFVDAALIAAGKGRDIEIDYIDVSYPEAARIEVDTVNHLDDEGLSVTT